MEEHATLLQDVYCLTLWFFILLILKGSYKPPYKTRRILESVGLLLIAVFCIFSYIDGDYFNYKLIYNDVVSGYRWHFENIYFWIIEDVTKSYTGFRICVWGGATLILNWAYNRLAEKKDLALFLFALCYLPWFAYARASVPMAMILLGLSYIVSPIKHAKLLSHLIGLTIIASSWFFHQSALVGMVAAIAALVLKNVNKRALIILFITIPLVSFAMGRVIQLFLDIDLSSEYVMISESARNDYFMGTTNSLLRSLGGGIGFALQNLLSLGGLYLSAVLFFLLVRDDEVKKLPETTKVCAAYVFIVVLVGFGILISPSSFSAMHYRILFFAMPANAIFLASVKKHGLRRPFYKLIFFVAAIGSAYNLFYSFYRCGISSL